MEYTMQPTLVQRSLIPGTAVSGGDVSAKRRDWQHERPCSLALDAFPTVNGTGVSAGVCRT
jgi:hypothetical protein